MTLHRLLWTAGFVASCATAPAPSDGMALAPLHQVSGAMSQGKVSAQALVTTYLARIERIDRAGPTLQSVLSINPNAVGDARRLDEERAQGKARGPLHGIPVLIKDNIETADPLPTTAGSLALKDNLTERDAPLVAGLRAAGAVILGKTNLSEWANFRSEQSISGWSGIGGQVRNPYILDHSPCGSSSGSGAAVAAGLAAGAVGTETNGSIICPSAANGIVGFKPTVGLVSQARIVPISSTQDTAGPMTRSVRDAALMLTAMVNRSDAVDYAATLSKDALKNRRVGVLRFAVGDRPEIQAAFDKALTVLKAAGATVVEIDAFEPQGTIWKDEYKILKAEFKSTLNAYLASTPPAVKVRSLADLIAFNKNTAREMALFGQDILVSSQTEPALEDPDYRQARDRALAASRENGIDKLLKDNDVTLLVAPTWAPAFMIDAVNGDASSGRVGMGWMAAIAGYPHLTVPMGFVRGLPIGLSFMSTKGRDAEILAAGFAYEARRGPWKGPRFFGSAEDVPSVREAMQRLVDTSR